MDKAEGQRRFKVVLYTAVTQNRSALVYIQKYVTLAGIYCSKTQISFKVKEDITDTCSPSGSQQDVVYVPCLMCLLFLLVYFSYCSDILPLSPADPEIN